MTVSSETIYGQIMDRRGVVWTWWREGVLTRNDTLIGFPIAEYSMKEFKSIVIELGGSLAPRRKKRYIE